MGERSVHFLFESHPIYSLEQIHYRNNTEFDKMRWCFLAVR